MKLSELKKKYNAVLNRVLNAMGHFDMNPDSIGGANCKLTEAWNELNRQLEIIRKTIEPAIGRELTNKETLEGFEL